MTRCDPALGATVARLQPDAVRGGYAGLVPRVLAGREGVRKVFEVGWSP